MKPPLAAVVLLAAAAVSRADAQSCRDHAYLGFDTRLAAGVVARLPLTAAPVAAFEVAGDRMLAIQGTSLLAGKGSDVAVADLKLPIRGLLVDAQQRVTMQGADGIYRLGASAPELAGAWSGGRLSRSGTDSVLEARQAATTAQLVLRHDDGRTLRLAAIPGSLRLAAWNGEGLAAVVGSSLFAWRPGEPELMRIATDEGLERARDVALMGAARAVVALNESIVLLTPQGRLVLGTLKARVRWAAGVLYVLDERTGTVWSLRGLEAVGAVDADEAYADALIRALPDGAPATHAAFLEAARILGCEIAEKLRARLRPAAGAN